ncbi:tRNA pseudouridine(55) synthase TruB [Thermosediminibacter oceani]|uniref:tRNA pseudouridine synthase B n=1 Tax=Thermosediminibacter oceani (strain ATCC BAA-1034 / DSM 16646 / JW/IW-1228P) TaxID=555079 RepID=D9S3L3_THEOJ|nr:tRNA pseudouridine(55) synthase TruB [Thermosediminibacter oceani]ADL07990.1 tRNA pseudouridine synthase B [Thermosediminibacter oceani DSM 16646]
MNGIINCLKPPGMTSHDAVDFLRKQLGIKKIGHGGTLDPGAAGVLPLFVGKATKAVEFFEETTKEYVAEMTLGTTTDTGDNLGHVLETKEVDVDVSSILEVLRRFVGKIEQIPPMYSAVHYKGRKLYELARRGITVERQPRTVEIFSLELIKFEKPRVLFRVSCSRGTYIRTLCEDIGRALGCGAHLSCLVRTRLGPFQIFRSFTLEDIRTCVSQGEVQKIIIPIDEALAPLMPSTRIWLKDQKLFFRGALFPAKKISMEQNAKYARIYDQDNRFLGVGEILTREDNIYLKVIKSFQ